MNCVCKIDYDSAAWNKKLESTKFSLGLPSNLHQSRKFITKKMHFSFFAGKETDAKQPRFIRGFRAGGGASDPGT